MMYEIKSYCEYHHCAQKINMENRPRRGPVPPANLWKRERDVADLYGKNLRKRTGRTPSN